MRKLLLFAFLLFALLSPQSLFADKKLTGTWEIDNIIVSGQITWTTKGKISFQPQSVEIEEKTIFLKFLSFDLKNTFPSRKFEYVVNMDQQPRTIDFKINNKTYPAIFMIDKDYMVICGEMIESERPKSFLIEKDTQHYILILKRVK